MDSEDCAQVFMLTRQALYITEIFPRAHAMLLSLKESNFIGYQEKNQLY